MKANIYAVMKDGEVGVVGDVPLITCDFDSVHQSMFGKYVEDNPEWKIYMYRNPIDVTDSV